MYSVQVQRGSTSDDVDRVRAADPERIDATLGESLAVQLDQAFGWPNREPSPAASKTPTTEVRTVAKRMRLPL